MDQPFTPSAVYYPEAACTELAIADRPMVWRVRSGGVSLGYDMETGALIAIRVPGDVARR